MIYRPKIREHNVPAHLDIEKDIKDTFNGLFTFTLRVNNGNIVDYNVTEVVDVRGKYLTPRSIVIQEYTISHTVRTNSK